MYDLSTFKTFMITFKSLESPLGDFAGDIARDKSYPDDEQTKERLTQYFDWQARRRDNPKINSLFNIAWEFYSSLKE